MTAGSGERLGPDAARAPEDGPAPIVPGSLGVFGGTFDPIHLAHLAVAEAARDALGLERVLFITAGEPPHKPARPITAAVHRQAMVELAIAGNPAFASSRIELDRPGPSYTADTLAALAAETPDLTLILSVEAFVGLPTWYEPGRVLELARLAIAPRDGYADADPGFLAERFPGARAMVVFLDGPRLRLSASELRAPGRRGPVAAVSRAGCGRGLYRRPWAVSSHQEG